MSKIKIYPNYLVIIDDNFVEPISITNLSSLARQTKRSEEYYLTKIVYEMSKKYTSSLLTRESQFSSEQQVYFISGTGTVKYCYFDLGKWI